MSRFGEPKRSFRTRQSSVDVAAKRNEIMTKIREEEENFGVVTVSKPVQRNIVLVGRTRTGKSTIKSMLINPLSIAEEQTLLSATKDPVFDTVHITWRKNSHTDDSSDDEYSEFDSYKANSKPENILEDLVLNIIDTPGLFEHGPDEFCPRDNETIMNAITACINSEITKIHVICFCVTFRCGINPEDIQALKLLLETIGSQIASNACLVVTHCESEDEARLKNLKAQLLADKDFKFLLPYFKKGIFFTGVLEREYYNAGNEHLVYQYLRVANFRMKILKMFSGSDRSFLVVETLISESKRTQKSKEALQAELEQTTISRQHAKEDLQKAQTQIYSKSEELQQIRGILIDVDNKLNLATNQLQQWNLDLEEKTNDLVRSRARNGLPGPK